MDTKWSSPTTIRNTIKRKGKEKMGLMGVLLSVGSGTSGAYFWRQLGRSVGSPPLLICGH
jgi:hypothetical protein